jgi:hypothetical protein
MTMYHGIGSAAATAVNRVGAKVAIRDIDAMRCDAMPKH